MPQPSPRTECLLQLVMAQLAALLQLAQLWTVLGGLTSAAPADPVSIADTDDGGNLAQQKGVPWRHPRIFQVGVQCPRESSKAETLLVKWYRNQDLAHVGNKFGLILSSCPDKLEISS